MKEDIDEQKVQPRRWRIKKRWKNYIKIMDRKKSKEGTRKERKTKIKFNES